MYVPVVSASVSSLVLEKDLTGLRRRTNNMELRAAAKHSKAESEGTYSEFVQG